MKSSKNLKQAANFLYRQPWPISRPSFSNATTNHPLKQFMSPSFLLSGTPSHRRPFLSQLSRQLQSSAPQSLARPRGTGVHWKQPSSIATKSAAVTRAGLTGTTSGARSYSQLGPTLQQRLRLAYRNVGGGDPDNMVYALIATNALVYLMWVKVDPYFMRRHFQVSVESLRSGRWHTLITSAFSQKETWHLFTNMMGLYFFGTEMARVFGPRRLLGLYLASGLVGSITHVLYCKYLLPWREGIPQGFSNFLNTPAAMGASAATNAIILLSTLMYPTRIIYVNLFIPVPAAAVAAFFIGQDFLGVFKVESQTAHAGHLGGALVGALFWARYRFRRWR